MVLEGGYTGKTVSFMSDRIEVTVESGVIPGISFSNRHQGYLAGSISVMDISLEYVKAMRLSGLDDDTGNRAVG